MSVHICSNCKISKPITGFYKNSKKVNGLESQCKLCVLTRKSKKYHKVKITQRKNKYLRTKKIVNVIDVNSCTFSHAFINCDFNYQQNVMSGMIEELICQWKRDRK